MSGFLRSRRVIGVFVAVVAIHVILGVATFGPGTSVDLSDVPVAVVDADGGELAGQLAGADVDLIEWKAVADRDAMFDGLDDKDYAAGLVIPPGASEALAGLAGEAPEPVALELFVNAGRNAQAAGAVEQAVVGLAEAAAGQVSAEALAGVAAAGGEISPEAVPALAEPIAVDVAQVNAPGDAADAQTPLVLVAMLWIGSLIAMLVTFLSLHRKDITPVGFLAAQLVVMAVLAVVQPLSIVAVGNWLLGLDISLTPALFGALALTTAMFFLIQSAVLNWLGFGGWPILVLLWLFSFTLLAVPVEGLATGYRVLVHSWLPARFPYEALQGLVFFDGAGQAGSMLAITAAITAGALAVLGASYYRLARADLSVNPLVKRIAATANDTTTHDTPDDDSDSDDDAGGGATRPTPATHDGRDPVSA